MTLTFLTAALRAALHLPPRPMLLYAVAWSSLLTATVALTSFAPEFAFVQAVTPNTPFSRGCDDGPSGGGGSIVRVPTEGPPREAVYVPAGLFRRSRMDLVAPPLFAALIVGGSTCIVRVVGLWEYDEDGLGLSVRRSICV